MIQDLSERAGGIDALEHLHDDPLPDAPFDWNQVAEADRPIVGEVLSEMDQRVPLWFGEEYQLVTWRVLERIAAREPDSLHRSTSIRTAAALTWLALFGNGAIGGRGLTASTVWAVFRVSSCADRGRGLYKATGLTPPRTPSGPRNRSEVWLSDESLLHSVARHKLLRRKQVAIAAIDEARVRRTESHPLRRTADGNLVVRASTVIPRWAIKAPNESGRSLVLVTFGETENDPEVLAFSVPDARLLVTLLQDALDSPSAGSTTRKG